MGTYKRSPIQQHTSAIVEGLIEESEALKNPHSAVVGRLRELFVSDFFIKVSHQPVWRRNRKCDYQSKGRAEQGNRHNHL